VIIIFLVFILNSLAAIKPVEMSTEFQYQSGDKIVLNKHDFSVEVSSDSGTECAVPGFNCGSGYRPPHPIFKIVCGQSGICPYVFVNKQILTASSGVATIESIKKCEQEENELCLRSYVNQVIKAEDCLIYRPLIQYCFSLAIPQTARGLCDQLPEGKNPYRKNNCFYDYAVSFKDPSLCDKFKPEDFQQRDRCLGRLAQTLRDKSLCHKISDTKEHNYKQQCLESNY